MIKVIVKGDRIRAEEVMVDQNTKIRDFMEEHDIVFTPAALRIDGVTLTEASLDMTFTEMNVKDQCYFVRSAKTDNN